MQIHAFKTLFPSLNNYRRNRNFRRPNSSDTLGWGLLYGPGFFFGLATAAVSFWFYRRQRKWPAFRALIWLAISVLSWRIALQVALTGDSSGAALQYTLAGLAGSAILAPMFLVLFHRIHMIRLGLVLASGGGLGYIMALILQDTSNESDVMQTIVAFVIWQVGVALVLIKPPAE
jgi:hypothetical protein